MYLNIVPLSVTWACAAAEAKVENGTLTVTDMLREITAENLARQTKALHEVQLLMNIWNLKYTLNN